MDIGDLIWNSVQDGNLSEVKERVDQLQKERDAHGWNAETLSVENAELKLRLGLLVRLLINKGLITAQEYAALIAETQAKTGNLRG